MARIPVKITYIPAQYRVRVEFTKADCLLSPEPPEDIIERAKAKLRRERKNGNVAFYRVFKTRLFTMWDALRANDDPPETRVAITVATGAPPMPGIVVEPSAEPGCLAKLTITASAEQVANWRFKLFKLTVGKYLRRLGIHEVADAGHLHGLWMRAARGEKIHQRALHPVPPLHAAPIQSGYSIQTRANDGEIHLIVYRLRPLIETQRIDQVVDQIRRMARSLREQTGKNYLILSHYLVRELESAYRGPERFGIDMPLVCLAAIEQNHQQFLERKRTKELKNQALSLEMTSPVGTTAALQEIFEILPAVPAHRETHPFDAYMTIDVAPDKLSATIGHFNAEFFRAALPNTEEIWSQFFASKHLVVTAEGLQRVIDLVTKQLTLQETVIAKGKPPVEGLDPYLMKVDAQKEASAAVGSAEDLRERQQRIFVSKGQPVARMAFRKPSTPGIDVFGREIPAAVPSTASVTLDENIEVKGDLFIAKVDGIPTLNTSSITLARALVVPGSVNLATGNVRFEGPVEIKGSVEEGATVHVNGDLVIRGMILGGTVNAAGNITVLGGITTNHHGHVHAGGNLTASFLAQANVTSNGHVQVEKNILNSRVTAAGGIRVMQADGVVSGGELACELDFVCGHLGRETGPATLVRVGCDARHEMAVNRIKGRLEKMQQALKNVRLSQSYRDKDEVAVTARRNKEKEQIHSQAERAQRIIQKLEAQLVEAVALVKPNSKVRIVIQQVLSRNCQLAIGGKPIPIKASVAGVAVHGEKQRGEFIVALEAA